MPYREDELVGEREVLCRKCKNFMSYLYSSKVYVCEVCGNEYKRSEILTDKLGPRKKQRSLTKRQKIKDEFGDLLDQMEEYKPEE